MQYFKEKDVMIKSVETNHQTILAQRDQANLVLLVRMDAEHDVDNLFVVGTIAAQERVQLGGDLLATCVQIVLVDRHGHVLLLCS